MIGQESIISKFELQILDKTFPRTILLLGEYGSGKHMLVDNLSNKLLHIPVEDITNKLSNEKLDEIQLCPLQKLYLIDGNYIDFKKQNILLKFFEEPLTNSFIVLLAESTLTLLPTILNRCQVYQMNSYSNSQLEEITGVNDAVILQYCRTPGKVLKFMQVDINTYLIYIDRMLTLLSRASWANILKLSENMYFNDKEKKDNKFSAELIFSLLKDRAADLYKNKSISFLVCQKVCEFTNNLRIPNINKKQLFENFIFSLKGVLV